MQQTVLSVRLTENSQKSEDNRENSAFQHVSENYLETL